MVRLLLQTKAYTAKASRHLLASCSFAALFLSINSAFPSLFAALFHRGYILLNNFAMEQ